MRSLLSQYWFFFRHYIVLSVQVKTDFSYDEKTLAFFESYEALLSSTTVWTENVDWRCTKNLSPQNQTRI